MLRACATCGHGNDIHAPSCGNCGRAFKRRNLTTTQRGYGYQHRKLRAALLSNAYFTPCPICRRPMLPGQALDLDHATPLVINPTSRGDRITHAHCNRRAGQALA